MASNGLPMAFNGKTSEIWQGWLKGLNHPWAGRQVGEAGLRQHQVVVVRRVDIFGPWKRKGGAEVLGQVRVVDLREPLAWPGPSPLLVARPDPATDGPQHPYSLYVRLIGRGARRRACPSAAAAALAHAT